MKNIISHEGVQDIQAKRVSTNKFNATNYNCRQLKLICERDIKVSRKT